MKKVILLGMVFTLFFVNGCTNDRQHSLTEENNKKIISEEKNTIYYKVPIYDYDLNIEQLLEQLMTGVTDYKMNVTTTDEVVDTLNGMVINNVNEVISDNRTYTWETRVADSSYFIWRRDDKSKIKLPVKNIKQGHDVAYSFVETLDLDVELVEEELFSIESCVGDVYSCTYGQAYENIPICNTAPIRIGKEEWIGPYMEIDVDGDGIWSVAIHGLVKFGTPLEQYTFTDFISMEQVKRQIENYLQIKMLKEPSEVQLSEPQIVYVPSMESSQLCVIPAYQIKAVIPEEGSGYYEMVVDVFTGYIYASTLMMN